MKNKFTALLMLFLSSVPLFSQCTDDYCSFDTKEEPLSFYGSTSSYAVYEEQNIDKHVFHRIGSISALDEIEKGIPDAGFFIGKTDEESQLKALFKPKESSLAIFSMAKGTIIIMGNAAFFEALGKDSLTSEELKNIFISGKIGSTTVDWQVSPQVLATTESLGFDAVMGNSKESVNIKKVIVEIQEALNNSTKNAQSKTPVIYFTNTTVSNYVNNDLKKVNESWREVKWQEAPQIDYYIAVIKGPNYDKIVSNLKGMKAKKIVGN
jgi:hypothetical protein